MRAHLTVEAAALVPVILWTVLAIAAGMFCRFSLVARFALAAGVLAGILMWAPAYFIRPDVHMAVAWVAGLIVLEGARLGGWNAAGLALGAFLLTLASELHYPMTPAFLGVAVYAVWMARELGLKRAAPRLGALVGGALILGIPYLVLFVIPHYSEIRGFAGGANGGFHPLRAFQGEIAAYRAMAASGQGGSFLSAVAAPFTHSRVPVAVAFIPFFLWRRDTRGIALACLPSVLFITFFDTENHELYDTGSFTLYFIAVAYAVGLVVTTVARRVRASGTVAPLIAGLGVLAVLLVFGRPAINYFGTRTSHPTHREMDIARAAGRAVIGVNGVVASFDASQVWYTTGGSAYYPLWRDIFPQTNLQQLNLQGYLRELPALAESNLGAGVSYWAAQGLVKARGFYFDWPLSPATRIRYIIYSSISQPVVGVARGARSAFVFATQSNGPWEFLSASCQGTSAELGEIGPWSLTADVPSSPGTSGVRRGAPRAILSVVARPATLARAAVLREHHCQILRDARLSAHAVTVGQLLTAAHKLGADRTMTFPGWVPAVDTLFGPRGRLTRLAYAEPLGNAVPGRGAKVRVSPDSVKVIAPSDPNAEAAAIPLKLPPDRSHLWIGMHVSVTRGTVGMCVFDVVTNGCAYPARSLLAPGSGDVYLEIPDTQDILALYIENVVGGPAEITLRGTGQLVRASPP
jgi:hypothetical protein